MYREDINAANELQSVSDAINDIADNCDHISMHLMLKEFLMGILQELVNTTDSNTFPLRISQSEKENF